MKLGIKQAYIAVLLEVLSFFKDFNIIYLYVKEMNSAPLNLYLRPC